MPNLGFEPLGHQMGYGKIIELRMLQHHTHGRSNWFGNFLGPTSSIIGIRQIPHDALVTLEKFLDEFLLITQNVDDLHTKAGSEKLIHMHGELCKLRCEKCGEVTIAMEENHLEDKFVACTNCDNERLRPHIVWFHEMPLRMQEIDAAVTDCDVFIAIGTSGHVYPAAGLLSIAQACGAHCIGIRTTSKCRLIR